MEKENSWLKYEEIIDKKAEKRERKKRKRMPVSGRGVFGILRQKIKH